LAARRADVVLFLVSGSEALSFKTSLIVGLCAHFCGRLCRPKGASTFIADLFFFLSLVTGAKQAPLRVGKTCSLAMQLAERLAEKQIAQEHFSIFYFRDLLEYS